MAFNAILSCSSEASASLSQNAACALRIGILLEKEICMLVINESAGVAWRGLNMILLIILQTEFVRSSNENLYQIILVNNQIADT